jgi:hypothetical protein
LTALVLKAEQGKIPLGAILGVLGGGACLVVGVLRLDHLPFTVCVFKSLTGRPCLTCGTTRTLGLLFRGDLHGALLMNPLAAFFALLLVPWALADAALLLSGRSLRLEVSPPLARVLRVAVVLAVLVNWAYLIAAGR